MSPLWLSLPGRSIPIYIEPHLEWEMWSLRDTPALFCGREMFYALVYAIQVKPNVLETDPGPLDARVP